LTDESTAGRSLRSVSIAITVLSIVVFSTIAYSAYQDSAEIINVSGSPSGTPAIIVSTVYHGTTAFVLVNITLRNDGLYPLVFAASCIRTPGGFNATCSLPSTTISPGQTTTVHLNVTVSGISPTTGTGGKPIDADFMLALEPFISMQVTANLGGLVAKEAAGQ